VGVRVEAEHSIYAHGFSLNRSIPHVIGGTLLYRAKEEVQAIWIAEAMY
jgi:hypothetical protein